MTRYQAHLSNARALRVLAVGSLLSGATACDPGPVGEEDTKGSEIRWVLPGASDAGARADASSDAAVSDAGAPTPTWDRLDAYLDRLIRDDVVHGFAMQVFDAEDRLLFQKEAGVCASRVAGDRNAPCPVGNRDYTVDLETGIASSSKWVASTVSLAVLEDVVERGAAATLDAALDTPISAVMRCNALRSSARVLDITMRQLLSFTSGLLTEDDCVGRSSESIQTCACSILAASESAMATRCSAHGTRRDDACPTGTVFRYGETHHVVAAAVVERLAAKPWVEVLAEKVESPLGVRFAYNNQTNPNIAGGIQTSLESYAKYVRAVFHDGRDDARRILSRAAVEAQRSAQAGPRTTTVLVSPQPDFDYGLNNWRYCFQPLAANAFANPALIVPDRNCSAGPFAVGHGGKGGYNPWVDMRNDVYAVFATREASPGGGADYTDEEQGVSVAVRLLVDDIMRNGR